MKEQGREMLQLAETYDMQKDYKADAPNLQALEVSIATGSSRISDVGVQRSPG